MPAANTLRMDDGFSTIITLANIPTVKIYEKDVTPPGMTAGGPIETTTMRNTAWRTFSPRQLKSLTEANATVAYATVEFDTIFGEIGKNQLVTVTFPDGSAIEFYGWLEEFTPATHTEGEQPTASMKIQPSNRDNNGLETEPNYIEPNSLT